MRARKEGPFVELQSVGAAPGREGGREARGVPPRSPHLGSPQLHLDAQPASPGGSADFPVLVPRGRQTLSRPHSALPRTLEEHPNYQPLEGNHGAYGGPQRAFWIRKARQAEQRIANGCYLTLCNRYVENGGDIFRTFSRGAPVPPGPSSWAALTSLIFPVGPVHSWSVSRPHSCFLPAGVYHLMAATERLPSAASTSPQWGGTLLFRPQNSCLKSALTSPCLLAQKSFPRGAGVQKRDRWSLSFYNTASLLK